MAANSVFGLSVSLLVEPISGDRHKKFLGAATHVVVNTQIRMSSSELGTHGFNYAVAQASFESNRR